MGWFGPLRPHMKQHVWLKTECTACNSHRGESASSAHLKLNKKRKLLSSISIWSSQWPGVCALLNDPCLQLSQQGRSMPVRNMWCRYSWWARSARSKHWHRAPRRTGCTGSVCRQVGTLRLRVLGAIHLPNQVAHRADVRVLHRLKQGSSADRDCSITLHICIFQNPPASEKFSKLLSDSSIGLFHTPHPDGQASALLNLMVDFIPSSLKINIFSPSYNFHTSGPNKPWQPGTTDPKISCWIFFK